MAEVSVDLFDRYLSNVKYPADKKELMAEAKKSGAPSDLIGFLNSLPDKEFANQAEAYTVLNRIIQKHKEIGPR